MPSIWEKYQKIEEMDSNSKIKTYKAKMEPIIKEIIPKDKEDNLKIHLRLEKIKKNYKLIEIIEENDKIYIVINKDDKLISEIDELLLTDELFIQKEGKIEGHGNPIAKNEILNLLKMEQSMCRITYETIKDGKLENGHGSGFFCQIENFPIKYALFTNNHILNESNLEIGKTIKFKYFESKFLSYSNNIVEKSIKLTSNRKIFTNKKLDYTCIEIFESDGINNFFKIEPHILSNQSKNCKIYKENDIFILQFLNENEISFSDGNIIEIIDNIILHEASTVEGSSGSPIIKRDKNNNYIIGLHIGFHETILKDKNKLSHNIGTTFDSILANIKEQINEINCIYIPDKDTKEIDLIHDYIRNISEIHNEEIINIYLEAIHLNRIIFENNIELYVNDKKIKFDYKYKCDDLKEIKVKFKFSKILTNVSYMFYGCSSLKKVDLSSFNTSKVKYMNSMFSDCSSLEIIDLSSLNTNNVIDMRCMFNKCSSLKSLDLSSFNTKNVKNMNGMLQNCSSLKSLDLSSFNTNNVIDMRCMFNKCSSLKSLDLSLFNTNNVEDMSGMFNNCSSLQSLNLSLFNTSNVINMSAMFQNCSSLKSLDLSSFNTNKVKDMSFMFNKCSCLKSLDLSLFNTNNVQDMTLIFENCFLNIENIKLNNKKDKIMENL